MTSIVCRPVIVGRTDGQAAAVIGKRHTAATVIVGSLTIDISTHLLPRSALPFVNSGVTSIVSRPVIAGRTDSHAAAVIGKRHTGATLIADPLTVDIRTHLRPGRTVPFEDSGLTSFTSLTVLSRRTDGQAAAVIGKRHTEATVIVGSLTIDTSTHLFPQSALPFVNSGVTRRLIFGRTDGHAGAVIGKRHTEATGIAGSLTPDISTHLRPGRVVPFVDSCGTSVALAQRPVTAGRTNGQAGAVIGKRHTEATLIVGILTFDISTHLFPRSALPFVDSGVTNVDPTCVVKVGRTDGQAAAVIGKRHTGATLRPL